MRQTVDLFVTCPILGHVTFHSSSSWALLVQFELSGIRLAALVSGLCALLARQLGSGGVDGA